MKKIPNLKGLSVEEAKDLLRKKSIKYIEETKKIFSLTVGNGKIVKAEEENKKVVLYESNRKLFLFIIIGTIAVTMTLAIGLTYGNGIYKSIKDQIIEITGQITEPELETEPGWGKERIVKVKKDAKGSKKIDHYEYCIKKNKDEECTWQETYTKNAIVSKTGTWHVIFRGVDIDGKKGRESTIIVFVDNEAPEIKEFKVEKEDEITVTVKTTAQDKDSGLVKIMYSLDGINYTEGKEEYTYEGLIPGEEYTLYVKAIDQVGNEKVVNLKLIKKTKEEIELEKVEEKETKESEKEWDTPQIDLKKLPSVFEYGEKYNLPSRYDFGNDDGIVVCKVDGIEEKDTENLTVGKHEVKCTATSNHKKEVQVEKEILVQAPVGEDEIFDGWIKLNLYYPENSYNWQWRYGIKESDTEEYEEIGWEDYTGPILVKVEDINKIYIRYDQKGEPQIIAPTGQVLVNIEPAKKQVACGGETQVSILFDQEALTKQYRINGGKWQDYQGPFPANGNTLIEARATKNEDVYNTDGELEYTKLLEGYDRREVKEEQCKEVQDPAINLNGIPSIVYMGENISLPSYYTYGTHEAGKVECTDQNGNKVVNTRFLTEGNYKVTCNLETADGIKKGPVSRSFTIERREQAPEVSLWELPSRIVKGDSYKLPSYYTYGSHGTGTITCQDELSNVITNTSDLELGDHTVTCILTAEDGKQVVDSRNIKVSIGFEPYIDLNHLQSTIYKGDFYSLPGTYDYGRPNSGIKECRVNGEVLTDTHSLDVGTYDILCSITNLAGQNATASRTINVVKRPIVPEPIYDPLKGPVITADPNNNTISEDVEVTITPEEEASVIKYSYDLHNWYTYKEPFMLYENKMIYAYYIRKSDGKQSDISEYYVKNIKERNLPYVRIDANPGYEVKEGTNVEVTISGSDYDTLEYSYDGVVYYPYTGPLLITQSKTVYAKGTNRYGSTKESVTIKTTTPPVIPEKLSIAIALNPNGTQGYIVNETEVIINYDSKAEHKYYKTSSSAEWQEYTGPFKVRQNTTVYAYATSKNGQGNAEKSIDFLVLGISDPIISIDKKPPLRAHSVKVHITWDKNAVVKKYRIKNEDGTVTDWKDWEDDIEIDENCTVEAYQEDSIGNTSKPVEYKITNIVPEPSYTSVAKGDYYLIKLNYPSTSGTNSREYKWKDNGNWKKYNQKGILLIKQDKVDNYNLKADGVEIEDENGNKVTIDIAHVYVLDVPLSEMSENLFMRWDNTKPASPTINFNTENVTTEVEVSISYAKVIVEKEYKIVYSDGTDSGWQEYTGSFKVNKNNTTIYARGKNRLEIYSETVDRTITNIDEVAPTITLTGDLKTPKQVVNLTVTGNDDKMLYMVKWARGKKTADYFNENKDDQGTSIKNGSTIQLEENGNYTFYAVDQAGNETIKQIKITNIDKEAPELSVNVLTPGGNNSLIDVEIDYGDSATKYYKIGDTETWTAYTDVLQLRTMEVYQLKNEDGSLTLTAKGTDEAGNETIISEKIYALDLNVPAAPVINAAVVEYPVITESGVKVGGNVSIIYDTSRNDLINTYSLDGGKTWQEYTGAFELEKATDLIKAKSEVSRNKNIYSSSEKALSGMASDAIGSKAYDEDLNTYYRPASQGAYTGKLYIAPEMQGKNIKLKYFAGCRSTIFYRFKDENGELVGSNVTLVAEACGAFSGTPIINIPAEAKYMEIYGNYDNDLNLYEIMPDTQPIISNTYVYPTIYMDGVKTSYNNVEIQYYSTASQKLYRIDDGEWQEYPNETIKLPIGKTIYAKSIDKKGNESLEATYKSVDNNDVIGSKAYDEDLNTYYRPASQGAYTGKLYIAPEMQGKNIKLKYFAGCRSTIFYRFKDKNGKLVGSNVTLVAEACGAFSGTPIINIPTEAKYMEIYGNNDSDLNLYEIYVYEIPVINSSDEVQSRLTSTGIEKGYVEVNVEYFPTSVIKQYKIGNGEWQNYTGKFKIYSSTTVYAKGINGKGVDTDIASLPINFTPGVLAVEAYDNDISTYATGGKLFIDSSAVNKLLNLDFESTSDVSFSFYDQDDSIISTDTRDGTKRKIDVVIPKNSSSVVISGTNLKIYETNINDLTIKDTPHISISNEGQYETSKTVTIVYPNGEYLNEYSIDEGSTWNTYTDPFTIDDATLIYARSTEDGRYISSSTYYAHNIYTTVTLDAGEFGTLDNTTLNLIAGESYGNLPIPQITLEGYNHKGWFLDSEFNEAIAKDSVVQKGDYTIYAKINDEAYLFGYIKDLAAVDQDNLITDTTSDANIRYYGTNPNNYVYFNCQDYHNPSPETCQKWRIVGLMNNLTNAEGETISAIKLIYPNTVGNGTGNGIKAGNIWGSSSARTYLNSTYYNTMTSFTKLVLLSVKTNYNAVTSFTTPLNVYTQERNGNLQTNDNISWLYPSDFGYSVSPTCWDKNMNSYSSCSSWLSTILNQYRADGPGGAYFVSQYNSNANTMYYKGNLNHTKNTGGFSNGHNELLGSYPTVYIDGDYKISSGTGSNDDPYMLEYVNDLSVKITLNTGEYGNLDNKSLSYLPIDEYGELQIPTVTSSDYEFEGWYLDSNYTEKVLPRSIVGNGNKTLYAKYIEKNPNSLANRLTASIYTSFDTVTEDNTEDKSIRYYGTNPNNYIYFNCQDYSNQTSSTCQKWRIVGLMNNITDSEGQTISAIKLINPNTVGNGTGNGLKAGNIWGSSSARSYLNSTYYNGLTENTKSLIISAKTNYNAVTSFTKPLNVYAQERNGSSQTNDNISWPYPSDFGYSVSPTCWDKNMNSYSSCSSWLSTILNQYHADGPGGAHFVSQYNSNANTMYYKGNLNHTKNTGGFSNGHNELLGSYPTVYISKDATISNGDGSSSDPYQLESK